VPQGVAQIADKLPADQARAALDAIQEAAKQVSLPDPDEVDYPWNLYFDFLALLEERVVKVGFDWPLRGDPQQPMAGVGKPFLD
jgi:hypothetical protein